MQDTPRIYGRSQASQASAEPAAVTDPSGSFQRKKPARKRQKKQAASAATPQAADDSGAAGAGPSNTRATEAAGAAGVACPSATQAAALASFLLSHRSEVEDLVFRMPALPGQVPEVFLAGAGDAADEDGDVEVIDVAHDDTSMPPVELDP